MKHYMLEQNLKFQKIVKSYLIQGEQVGKCYEVSFDSFCVVCLWPISSPISMDTVRQFNDRLVAYAVRDTILVDL